jgi:hypothetical protein
MTGPAQTLAAALDFLRFDEIARLADQASSYWRSTGLAASAVSLSEIARALPISKNLTAGFTPAWIPAFARAGEKKRARNSNGD